MNDVTVLDLGHKAILLTLMLCGPMLIIGMVVGLVVSVFQAATQIHESTMTFVPKIVAVIVVVVVGGPWMLTQITTFTTNLLTNIPNMVK